MNLYKLFHIQKKQSQTVNDMQNQNEFIYSPCFSKYHFNGYDFTFIAFQRKYKKGIIIYDYSKNTKFITEYYSMPKCKEEAEEIINDLQYMTLLITDNDLPKY